jgi:peptide/nickel transport system substrate-binding protein
MSRWTPLWRAGMAAALAGALVSFGAPALSLAQGPAPFVLGYAAWPPLAALNPFSPTGVNMYGLVNTPLAYFLPGNGQYVPELAKSWSVVSHSQVANDAVVTIHLRPGAKWSNGTPITANDVKVSLELGYILGYQVNGYIQSIETPNAHTVIVTQNTIPFNLFANQVLTSWIYPAQVWGQYVPANVAELYAKAQAGSSAAEKTLQTAAANIAAVRLTKYIAGGPYNYVSETSDEIVLNQNMDYWGAASIKVPAVSVLASSGNTQSFAYALSGRADILSTYAPPSVVEPFVQKPGDHILSTLGNYGPGLFFNTNDKPFNLLAVRQAIAYIINRPRVAAIANPTPSRAWFDQHGVPKEVSAATAATYPNGLPPAFYSHWLTAATREALNPYHVNHAKAAQLLESVGMKKVHGQWMYKGKPFGFSIAEPSAYTNQVAAADEISTELSEFGINATVQAEDINTYYAQAFAGDYPVAILGVGSPERSPWYDYGHYMTDEGLSINAQGVISRAKTSYNWGPVVNVPGLGKENVVDLWNNLATTNDHAALVKDVNVLARTINYSLPAIDLWYTQAYAVFYNTNTYTGFPKPSNPLWSNWIFNEPSTVALLIEAGYLHPR